MTGNRDHWASRLGFVLAAAGSAVGLGNIWKFPYITGEYGGGLFVLIYLVCIALVGAPIMIAEVIIGRATQCSPVGAFSQSPHLPRAWSLVGWMGVLTGFIILSYYSVVAGWSMHYIWLSVSRAFIGLDSSQIGAIFGEVHGSAELNVFWHFAFMIVTTVIVMRGVSKGIENASKILMPALMALLVVLLVDAVFQPGFPKALYFLFAPHAEKLSGAGIMEALGHSFFTLSLGMGGMLTYGSYLSSNTDIVKSSLLVSLLDTVVALAACLVLFPIIFTVGMDSQSGPGLVFQSIPIALMQITGGYFLSIVFFILLFFAALSSAISLLEVVTATMIDQLGWARAKAAVFAGVVVLVVGIPSALSGVTGSVFNERWASIFGKTFFDSFDWLASSVFLPLGGLCITLYVGWVMPENIRRNEFCQGSVFKSQYPIWLVFVRFIAPTGILLLFLFSLGILPKEWLT